VSYFFILYASFTVIRLILNTYLDRRSKTVLNSHQILLVGTRERIAYILDALESLRSLGHQVIGFLDAENRGHAADFGIPVLGTMQAFDSVLTEHHIDEVIFALPRDCTIDFDSYLKKCEKIGVAFRIVPGLLRLDRPSMKLETLQGIPTLAGYSWNVSASALLYKRVLDLFAGLLGFIVFLILYPVIGLAIKLDSPGPVLFKQKRIGLHGRKFRLYKFRSMISDADTRKEGLLVEKNTPWPIYKSDHDPRVTRVGAFLRKTSLDELPQFINVLKGEMSLVGTRPPTPQEVENYEDWHHRRISIKSGITGLWQISGRKEISDFAEVVRLDLEYIDQWRFTNDLLILWKTLWAVLARKGAK
jgi:exopolysaccharide biosynthesis polyprenyl glycosylphosphotransferase